MILGLIFAIAGIGILAALVFRAAIYALPVAIGIWVLQQAIAFGLHALNAIVLAILAGALMYGIGHVVFETSRSVALRTAVAALFVVPAVLAGYALASALLTPVIDSPLLRDVLAGCGGAVVGGATLARLTRAAAIVSAAN